MTWTLAERYAVARVLAIDGTSIERIVEVTKITPHMAQIIWARVHPDIFDPFGELRRGKTATETETEAKKGE